jgi:hypothetical protein
LPAKVHKKNEISKYFAKSANDLSFQMLPTDFTKQEAIEQAQVRGVSLRTIDYWLIKYVQSNEIQRIMNGKYQKIKGKIA